MPIQQFGHQAALFTDSLPVTVKHAILHILDFLSQYQTLYQKLQDGHYQQWQQPLG
jgi:hypothetical protein